MSQHTTDQTVLEAHRAARHRGEDALRQGRVSDAEKARLGKINVELDRCWDLLRQRRALREFGRDPDEAEVRPASVVENYKG